jgi:Dolichyl-phosphate-mannose-protein mannosyltransferase
LISTSAKGRIERILLFVLCAAFVALGWPFLKRMGIEVDEAMVGSGIYERAAPWYSWHIFRRDIPVMLISYLGALKSWICAAVFAIWAPGPVSLRLPTAMLGAGTVALFWRLLDDISGRRAAWMGAVLLATDTSFLLLTTIDFGPVALQLFLKTTAMVLLVRWHRTRRRGLFAAAWFLLGLALWDKAVFLWIAAGMAAGAVAAFPQQVIASIRPKLVATAVAAFCLGALPLIVFNVAKRMETIRANAKVSGGNAFVKVHLLRETINGRALFGFYTALDTPPQPGNLETPARRALVSISRAAGTPAGNWTVWALLAALASMPLIWRTSARAPALFGIVSFAGGWLAMAITAGAGAAAHHVALLWPMHLMVIAVVCAELSRRVGRWLLIAVTLMISGTNLLVTSQYYQDLVRNGPAIRWTDAIGPVTHYLEQSHPDHVFVMDWGILESVNLLSKGRVPVLFGNDYTSAEVPPDRIAKLRSLMIDRGTLFISHSTGFEQLPGTSAALDNFAAAAGYLKEPVATIRDRHGRPTFDVFRFRP